MKETNAINIPLKPDAESLYDFLLRTVTNNGDRQRLWTDLSTTATGSFILRSIASVGADLMFSIERAQHEVFLETARRPSSIFAAAKMLGVHISRKIPATIAVKIAREETTGQKIIPAFSNWSVGGIKCFNRQRIVFPQGIDLIDINLFIGEMTTVDFSSDGQARQEFIFGPTGFKVSDADVFCFVVEQPNTPSVEYSVVKEGLWESNNARRIVQVVTTIDGRCKAIFGNGISGFIPPAGSTIFFTFAVVDTAIDFANVNIVGQPVTCKDDLEIGGVVLEKIGDALPERPPEFYARNAAFIRSGRLFGNTRDNMRALLLEYPGIIDAKIKGQAEINPKDLRWMNVVEAIILTPSTFSQAEINQIVAFMHSRSCASRHFHIKQAKPVNVNVSAQVFAAARANLNNLKLQIESIVREMFSINKAKLGQLISIADISHEIIKQAKDPYGRLVSFVTIDLPKDIKLDDYSYPRLGDLNVEVSLDRTQLPRFVNGATVPGSPRIGTLG